MAIRADQLNVGQQLEGRCGRVPFAGRITQVNADTVIVTTDDRREVEVCPIWCDHLLVDGCPTEKYKTHEVKPKETNAMYPLKDKRCYDCRKKFSPHSGVQKYCDPCREKRGRPPAPASAQEAPVQPKAPATPPAAAASAERQTLADKIMASVPSAQPPVPPAGPGEVTSPAPAAAAPAVAAVAAATASSVGSGEQDRSPAGVGGQSPALEADVALTAVMTHDHAKLAALNHPVTEMLSRLERRIHRVASELQRLHIAHDVMTTMILEGK